MSSEHFDVLIVGAGLSGIGAGYHLQKNCPGRRFALFEARDAIGGTWDLFRYPGVRSDSDMYTLGYAFRPWTHANAIADGATILDYVRDTAKRYGIDRHIRFGHRVVSAAWSSAEARWTVDVARGSARVIERFTCNFLFMCSGYYDYEQGHAPTFSGVERFSGRIVHPQRWTADIDYAGKRIVVIGSGATAVTLVPELAKEAAHVTMLQRSPTYVVSRPVADAIATFLRRWLPSLLAYRITRWKNVLLGMLFFRLCRRYPQLMRRVLARGVTRELGEDYDVARHFAPAYNPWDQRLCLVPNGDLFQAIRAGRASVVTDHIETFTERGIQLRSGRALDADLVVTATGLELLVLGGMRIEVDGHAIDIAKTLTYKGMMLSGVPNLAIALGYTNASWTLKCDLTCDYVCRLLNYMTTHGYRQCVPRPPDPSIEPRPWIDFSSGYVQRAADKLPQQGSKKPWRLYQNYLLDLITLKLGSLEDESMRFSR